MSQLKIKQIKEFNITSPSVSSIMRYDGDEWVDQSDVKINGDGTLVATNVNFSGSSIILSGVTGIQDGYVLSASGNSGLLYFKEDSNSSYNFLNGLNLNGSDVKLGGILTDNTTIDCDNNDFTINNANDTVFVSNDSMLIGGAIETIIRGGDDGIIFESNDSTLNKRGVLYDIDYSTSWDNGTPDNIIVTKGYVDRKSDLKVNYIDGTLYSPGEIITVTHSIGTDDYIVQVWDEGTGMVILPKIDNPTNSTVDLTFEGEIPQNLIKVMTCGSLPTGGYTGVTNFAAVTGSEQIITNNIDLSSSNHFRTTLTSNTTFGLTNLPTNNSTFVVAIEMGGSGGYTVTFDKLGYNVKYISLEVSSGVGDISELWCRYENSTNTLYVNSVTGYQTL